MKSQPDKPGKLRLHREVVRRLTISQASAVRGGEYYPTSDSCYAPCDPTDPGLPSGNLGTLCPDTMCFGTCPATACDIFESDCSMTCQRCSGCPIC